MAWTSIALMGQRWAAQLDTDVVSPEYPDLSVQASPNQFSSTLLSSWISGNACIKT